MTRRARDHKQHGAQTGLGVIDANNLCEWSLQQWRQPYATKEEKMDGLFVLDNRLEQSRKDTDVLRSTAPRNNSRVYNTW